MKKDPPHTSPREGQYAFNGLCLCKGKQTCINCVFCLQHHSPQGRKALAATIMNFLVFTPVYQRLVEEWVQEVFPGKIIYEDEKEIASMLFEAVTFEAEHDGYTPFAYFLTHAQLSEEQRRLYAAWQANTRFGFFKIGKIIPLQEVHLTDIAGVHTYKVYETQGTRTLKEGMVVVARLVPFLDGWMFLTESIVSYSSLNEELAQKSQGVPIRQLAFVKWYRQKYNQGR
jgi:hypothetical protein